MHMQGTPRDMQAHPRYDDLLGEMQGLLSGTPGVCRLPGHSPGALILDPGIGFGKTLQHNLEILNHLDAFLELGCPLMVGPSRKAFIGHLLGACPWRIRDIGTLAALGLAVLRGARLVRTHNAAYASQFFAVLTAIRTGDLQTLAPWPKAMDHWQFLSQLRWQDAADIILVAIIIYQVFLFLKGTQAV